MSTIIFKTNAELENPKFAVDKLIVDIPGGLQKLISLNNAQPPEYDGKARWYTELYTSAGNKITIDVYNGKLVYPLNDDDNYGQDLVSVNPNVHEIDNRTDSFGNVIRTYEIEQTNLRSQVSAGTTRFMIHTKNLTYLQITIGGTPNNMVKDSNGNFINIGQFDIAQFANLPNINRILADYIPDVYGDLSSLKNRTGLTHINLSYSKITGDLSNLVASGSTLVEVKFAYCSKAVTGDANAFLDAIAPYRTNGSTLKLNVYNTSITLNGQTGQGGTTTITFNGQGGWTVNP